MEIPQVYHTSIIKFDYPRNFGSHNNDPKHKPTIAHEAANVEGGYLQDI